MPEIPGVRTFPFTKIVGLEHIKFGRNIIIDDFVFIYATDEHVIGDYVHIASFTSITGGGKFYLQDFASVSSGCRILTGTDDFTGGGLVNSTIPSEYRPVKRGVVRIGKHVAIGANVVILPDVEIGEGCAIGAGSVVMGDLKPWGTYLGFPARRIRERPSERILAMEKDLRARYG
jgi:acetyltransferase-like isoleucine patch superfamily enzyme